MNPLCLIPCFEVGRERRERVDVHLCGKTNDTASRSGSSIAGLLALFVAALAEVVGALMNDEGSLETDYSQ